MFCSRALGKQREKRLSVLWKKLQGACSRLQICPKTGHRNALRSASSFSKSNRYPAATSASVSFDADEQPSQPPMWYAAKTQRAARCCASAASTVIEAVNRGSKAPQFYADRMHGDENPAALLCRAARHCGT